jgi:hydroxymethylglutaryl-CoA reductase (NADPH)
MDKNLLTTIPTRWVGPLFFQSMMSLGKADTLLSSDVVLATFETTLFFSVSRGMRAIAQAGGITSSLIKDTMVRSVTLEVDSVALGQTVLSTLKREIDVLQKMIVEPRSRFAQLQDISGYFVANLLYLRIEIFANNASGHNMVTLIADAILDHVLQRFPGTRYVSVSGNMCVDKKVSVINALEGRGKHVISEVYLPRDIVEKTLKTTPEKIVELNVKKNMLGSIMAGSVHSANAHFANMLLAAYLATGQDAANIVEGSQGITFAEVRNDGLYFSVNIPNIVVGTVGNGKHDETIVARFEKMHCLGEGGAQRYAHLVAGTVLAGELSLMAALTTPHELIKAHVAIERK